MANLKIHFSVVVAVAVISCNTLPVLSSAIFKSYNNSLINSSSIKSLTGSEDLDTEGKYKLSWEVNQDEQTIYFEVVAETTGYVGFGISPSGSMTGADILIAGVKADKSLYSKDYHGVGNTRPVEDAHDDWTVTHGEETETHTTLRFHRLLNTCDKEDFEITDATMRIIWSMGQTDEISYHGEIRGTKSVNFFVTDGEGGFDPAKFQNIDLTVDMTMLKQHTTYWCTIHEFPLFSAKQHIVGFEPILESLEAVQHTHHYNLYRCVAPEGQDPEKLFAPWVGHAGDICYEQQIPEFPFDKYCYSQLVYVWSKGGKRLVFPPNLGFPMPEVPGQKEYYALEVHYDNPQELEGLKFKTGSRIFYTPNLRETDVGLMVVEQRTLPQLTIPPKVTDFVVSGHCSGECTQQFLPEEGVTIFNVMLHAHLTGRKIKLRQFRGDEELAWVDSDDYYDFNFQQNKPLQEGRKFERGDQLTVECTHDTRGVEGGKAVLGGLSSKEEMCQAWFFYFPKQRLIRCGSEQKVEDHFGLLGMTKYELKESGFVGGGIQYDILEPESLAGDYLESVSYKVNWTPEFLERFQDEKRFGVQQTVCYNGEDLYEPANTVKYPDNLKVYQPPDNCPAQGFEEWVKANIGSVQEQLRKLQESVDAIAEKERPEEDTSGGMGLNASFSILTICGTFLFISKLS